MRTPPAKETPPRRRRNWDSTIQDLSVHRATKLEQQRRHDLYRSPNADRAREELARAREREAECAEAHEDVPIDLDAELATATAPPVAPPPPVRCKVETTLTLPVVHAEDASGDASHPVAPRIVRAVECPIDLSDADLEEEDDEEIPTDLAANATFGAAVAPPTDVPANLPADLPADLPATSVDLDHEIALFRQRTHERIAAAAETAPESTHELDEAVKSLDVAAPPVATPPQPAAKAAKPAAAQAEPAAEPADASKTARAPKPRRAWGAPAPKPRAATASARAASTSRPPDTLGVARLQHVCGKLQAAVAGFESSGASRGAEAAGEAGGTTERRIVPRAAPSDGEALVQEVARASSKVSFSAVNEQLFELLTKLVGHVQRSDVQLEEQARVASDARAELAECRAAFASEAEASEKQLTKMRREAEACRREHGVAIAKLHERIGALEASRNDAHVRSLLSCMQDVTLSAPSATAVPPAPAATPPVAASVTSAVPAGGADAKDVRAAADAVSTASLFTPLDPPRGTAELPVAAPLVASRAAPPALSRAEPGRSGPNPRLTPAAPTHVHVATSAGGHVAAPAGGHVATFLTSPEVDDDDDVEEEEEEEFAPETEAVDAPPADADLADEIVADEFPQTPTAPPLEAYAAWGQWGARMGADLLAPRGTDDDNMSEENDSGVPLVVPSGTAGVPPLVVVGAPSPAFPPVVPGARIAHLGEAAASGDAATFAAAFASGDVPAVTAATPAAPPAEPDLKARRASALGEKKTPKAPTTPTTPAPKPSAPKTPRGIVAARAPSGSPHTGPHAPSGRRAAPRATDPRSAAVLQAYFDNLPAAAGGSLASRLSAAQPHPAAQMPISAGEMHISAAETGADDEPTPRRPLGAAGVPMAV